MRFSFVPTLQIMRDLYTMPRDQSRFDAYLQAVIGGAQKTADVALPPLIAANPMAREHMLEFVEAWMTRGADQHAAQTLEDANRKLGHVLPEHAVKLGLVAMDDLRGGWTNRFLSDVPLRFNLTFLPEGTPWATVPLWVSEPVSLENLGRTILETVYRVAYVHLYPKARTLSEMMHQEGFSSAFAGQKPRPDAEELDYTRMVIEPLRDTLDYPVQFACLYGDEAATSVGYAPQRLSERAGLQVALANALESGIDPVQMLEKPCP
jgi:hypothetical protein